MDERQGAQPAKPRPPSSGGAEAFLAIFLLAFTVGVVALCCGINSDGTGGRARGPSPCERLLAKTTGDLEQQLRGIDDARYRLEHPELFPRATSGWRSTPEQREVDRGHALMDMERARPLVQAVADKVASGAYREAWTEYTSAEQKWLVDDDVRYDLYKLKEDCD